MSFSDLISNNIILESICYYLHPTHLLQCTLVSKELRCYFAPRLWSVIDLNRQYVYSISAFHRNQELNSKSINLPKLQHITKQAVPTYPFFPNNLVKVYQPTMSIWSISHLDLLSSLIHLRKLYLLIPCENPKEPIYKLPNVLSLIGLRMLDIIILTRVQTDLLRDLIFSAHHCESFHVTINVDTTDPQKIVNLRESLETLQITKFQDLKIKTLDTDIDLMIAAPLLKKSPQMTCFYLCDPYTCATLQQVSNILLDESCYRLKYVGVEETVNHLQDNSEYWDAVRCFFRDVSDKYMDGDIQPIICFKQTRAAHCRRKQGDDPVRLRYEDDIMLNVYSRCFSENLTSLELEKLSIPSLVVLLCRLPLLLNLSVSVFQIPLFLYPTPNIEAINFQEAPLFIPTPMVARSFQGMETGDSSIRGPVDDNLMTALSRISWVCTGIKCIKLRINHIIMINYTKVFLDCLFKNIGRLHRLEELSLGDEYGILTTSATPIRHGLGSNDFLEFLLHLKDLKLLSRVDLRNCGVRKNIVDIITLNDIKFMIDSWPELQYLTLQSRCLQASEIDKIADITARRGIKLIIFNDII